MVLKIRCFISLKNQTLTEETRSEHASRLQFTVILPILVLVLKIWLGWSYYLAGRFKYHINMKCGAVLHVVCGRFWAFTSANPTENGPLSRNYYWVTGAYLKRLKEDTHHICLPSSASRNGNQSQFNLDGDYILTKTLCKMILICIYGLGPWSWEVGLGLGFN